MKISFDKKGIKDILQNAPEIWNINRPQGYISLVGIDLPRMNLDKLNLSHCDMAGAYLRGSSLRGADLRRCCLMSADLRGADLTGAITDNTTMFSEANLTDAIF